MSTSGSTSACLPHSSAHSHPETTRGVSTVPCPALRPPSSAPTSAHLPPLPVLLAGASSGLGLSAGILLPEETEGGEDRLWRRTLAPDALGSKRPYCSRPRPRSLTLCASASSAGKWGGQSGSDRPGPVRLWKHMPSLSAGCPGWENQGEGS